MTHRAWMDAAGQELARCRRHGRDAAVVLFDVDRFGVNDGHGHAAGDAVPHAVAGRCAAVLRPAVLLPDADQAGAARTAERMRAALADEPVEVGRRALPVTASFGVRGLCPAIADAEAWLAAADAGPYAAKAGGRNRCCIADGRPASLIDPPWAKARERWSGGASPAPATVPSL